MEIFLGLLLLPNATVTFATLTGWPRTSYNARKMMRANAANSHASLVESAAFKQLPTHLQTTAVKLNEEVAGFRNERVEHDIEFWRRKSTTSIHQQGMGAVPEAAMHLEWSHRPLAEIWISLHDYLTEVAKFIGSEIG